MNTKNKGYTSVYGLLLFNLGLILIINIIFTPIIKGFTTWISLCIAPFIVGYFYSYRLKKHMKVVMALIISFSTIVILTLFSLVILHFLIFKNAYFEIFGGNINPMNYLYVLVYLVFQFVVTYLMLIIGSGAYLNRIKKTRV
jgi:hypothetical protein